MAGYTTVIEQLETNEDRTVTRNTLTSIPEVTVDGSTLPTTINGTYTANPQSVLINFVDDDNLFEGEPKVVKSDTIDGVTGQNISLNLSVPEHYVLAENQTLPTDYTFTVAKNQSITIHLKEKVDQVTDPVQLNKTISRKITINKPGEAPIVINQSATFTRTGETNEVTGKTTYSEWQLQNNDLDEVTAPTVAG